MKKAASVSALAGAGASAEGRARGFFWPNIRSVPKFATTYPLRIEVITEPDDLRPLRTEWNRLLQRSADNVPFLSYEWLSTWWQAFAGDAKPYVVLVRRGSRLLAIAPLSYTTTRMYGVPKTALRLWSNAYSNRVNFIVRKGEPDAVPALLDHLLTEAPAWDLADFGPLDVNNPLTRTLIAELRKRPVLTGRMDSYSSPYLVFTEGWDGLLGNLTPSFHETLQRKVRKAHAQGMTAEVTDDPGRIGDVMTISQKTWQHREGSSIASSAAVRGFYEELARVSAADGGLQLAFLKLDGTPISFEYNLRYNNVVYNLKLGYVEEYAKASPGLILKYHSLRQALESGARAYDFLGAAEHYKCHWTRQLRSHVHLLIFRRRFELQLPDMFNYCLKPLIKERAPWLVALKRRLW